MSGGTIVLLSGPNLDLLGDRQPEIYGTESLAELVEVATRAAEAQGYSLEHRQSNHEGDLVEAVHAARRRAVAIVVNAGALSHTSWSLHDALAAFDGVVVELHLSNPAAREPFRHTSVIAPVADGCIAGFGPLGYRAGDRCRGPGAGDPERCRMSATDGLAPLEVDGRLDRLRARLDSAGPEGRSVDALLVTTPANVRWLTGFSGSAGLLLVAGERAWLTTDGRYRTQAAEQLASVGVASQIEVVVGDVRTQRQALLDGAGTTGVRRVGLEADRVTWAAKEDWARAFEAVELEPTRGVVEALRVVKDAGEVARMERAAGIADAALAELLPRLSEAAVDGGALTESEFAADLDHAMRRRGAEESAFETIVASGENSAKPHARPGPRRIRRGDRGRHRLRRDLRWLSLRHDTNLLRGGATRRRTGQGLEGGE